jgi:SAP domain-containing ribonucleoprotein
VLTLQADPEPLNDKTEESRPEPITETATPSTLTPEQQAMKSRAERFGIPFNPNPTPTTKKTPAPAPKSDATTTAPAKASSSTTPAAKEKVGAIDKASLGISEETLAKRAAKFGIPEKKETPAAEEKVTPAKKDGAAPAAKKAESEITP